MMKFTENKRNVFFYGIAISLMIVCIQSEKSVKTHLVIAEKNLWAREKHTPTCSFKCVDITFENIFYNLFGIDDNLLIFFLFFSTGSRTDSCIEIL